MSGTLSVTDSSALTVLRAFLTTILPAGVAVIGGQGNRVVTPPGDYVVMTPILRERLMTNLTDYYDPFPAVGGARMDTQSTRYTVQLDVHGPAAADNSQIITTMFRSDLASEAFTASGFAIAPLYADTARQMAFINAENQYENRWSIDAVMEIDPVLTTSQQFAAVLEITPISVDATFPVRNTP